MQVKKEEVRQAILKAAADEFMQHGFLGASMREIARKAECSLSNLYNYFESKDDLLSEIVKPTTSLVMEALSMCAQGCPRGRVVHSFEFKRQLLEQAVTFVNEHRLNLQLLLLKADGSRMRDFKEFFIERYTDLAMRYLEALNEGPEKPNAAISRFFIRNMSSFYATTIEEMVRHDLPLEKMQEYANELLRYSFNGFQALLAGRNLQ